MFFEMFSQTATVAQRRGTNEEAIMRNCCSPPGETRNDDHVNHSNSAFGNGTGPVGTSPGRAC